jgi:hypothetical protein
MTLTASHATTKQQTYPGRLGPTYAMLAGVLLHTLGVWLLVDTVNDTLRSPASSVDVGTVLLAGLVGSVGLVIMLTTAFLWALRRR